MQREKMQNAGEIIKEKTGFRKNKREISKGKRKSKSEQDLNVFTMRTNVKYWRKNRKWMRNTIRNFPTDPSRRRKYYKNILYFGR